MIRYYLSLLIFTFLSIHLSIGQCNNASAFGSATAPGPGSSVTISICVYAGEYSTLSSVVAGATYTVTSSTTSDFITVRQGTPGGTVIAFGTQPLNWTATVAGTYYIHTNTNSSCGTQSSCRSISVSRSACTPPAAPTSVAASPSTICGGTNSSLSAVSAGNTIRWYTASSGGTLLGSSASGAGFNVTPSVTTTYWAEAYNGSCGSSRVSVTVNVLSTPSAPSPVTANPSVMCSGATSQLNAMSSTTGFTGSYAPANWTQTNPSGDGGSVNASSAPTSISMTSSNNFSGGASSVFYTITVPASGNIVFNWNYSTIDAPIYDYPQYAINGVIIGLIPGYSGAGGYVQSGTGTTIAVTAGQTFSFVMTSGDNFGGSATTVFSNFTAPGMGSNSITWWTVSTGGTSIGSSSSGANFSVAPTTTTTYYAAASNGTCSSATRTPVTVEIESPTAPNPVTASPMTICPDELSNLNATVGSTGSTQSGFANYYAPANWTVTHAPAADQGTVNTSNAPTSVTLISSNGGNYGVHSVFFTIPIQANGDITFNWSYITYDIDGSAYDLPQYAINGVIQGNICSFVSGGPVSQSGTCTIPVLEGQTFSLVMSAIDDIMGSAHLTVSNFVGPLPQPNTVQWFTVPTGGASIGTSANQENFPVTPGTTTTYYAQTVTQSGCVSTSRTPITVTVNTNSTAPNIVDLPGSICPNTTVPLTTSGGVAGTGSNVYWYSGPNGTGTLLGVGTMLNIAPSTTTTYYARRQGTCNTTGDDVTTVYVKTYVYASNATTSSNYCTDNSGWKHFYVGDEIIFSAMGDFSMVPVGFPLVTIFDNGSYYQESQGPGTSADCINGGTPGEERFEMERSWNLNMGGAAPSGIYSIRFYFQPMERTAIINAANAWIAAHPACDYTYKYAYPDGFYWFKNSGSNYTAPDYDGTHYGGTPGTTPNGVNYTQWAGINGFSGGSGAVILVPNTILPITLSSFNAECNQEQQKVTLKWTTDSEHLSSHFTIQRSTGNDLWTVVGSVQAAGESNQLLQYEMIDNNPERNEVAYYRLVQYDFNGDFEVFGPISSNCFSSSEGMRIQPNPATSSIQVFIDSQSFNEHDAILITDLSGKEIWRSTASNLQLISIDDWQKGMYIVHFVQDEQIVRHQRFIKQ